MSKLIQELLPKEIACAKETKELLTDCCVGNFLFKREFIHLISSEANEICEKEKKKTIAGDHVIAALKNLGFDEYIKEMEELLEEYQKNV
jgi:histone H3/H4